MLETILSFERELFLAINHFHTPWLDSTLYIYTGFIAWIPFILFLGFALIYRTPRRVWLPVIVGFLGVVIMGHVVSGLLFKPFFERLRPTFHPNFMNDVKMVFNYTGGGLYGFISGHSTFSFGVATFTSLLFRHRIYSFVIYTWALLMVYSRLYLGVHFISDVVPGMLAGCLIGWGGYKLYRMFLQKKDPEQYSSDVNTYSGCRKSWIAAVLAAYILLIFLLGYIDCQNLTCTCA